MLCFNCKNAIPYDLSDIYFTRKVKGDMYPVECCADYQEVNEEDNARYN